jgi:hypothetical protein
MIKLLPLMMLVILVSTGCAASKATIDTQGPTIEEDYDTGLYEER